MEAVLPSIITGLVTMTGSILTFIATNKKNKMEQDETHKQQLEQLRDNLERRMDADREEVRRGMDLVSAHIKENSDNFSEMRAQTQNWQSVMEVKFDNLEAKVMKHNNFMERIATLEKDVAVLQNREKVSENRLRDLEESAS